MVTDPHQAPLLQSSSLRLIPYGAAHDEQTIRWLNDPGLQRSFGLSRKVTPESHRAWIEANPGTLIWAISDQERHLGNVLLHLEPARRSAYFQIYLGDSASRGRGIGWQAPELVLDLAFRELGLHRVWLHTLPGNNVAVALYTKAGFVREGAERDGLFRDGGFLDQYRWSLLAPEWIARKEPGEE